MGFTYPVMLSLDGVPVLLVGGGNIASRKAEGLVAAGALLTVVAPEIRAELAAVAHRLERRPYQATDIAGHRLVMTATDNPAVNAQVGRDATELGVWVNSADDPANCSFILPAVARRGPVTVAVGTDGSSPALARTLRDRIANEVVTALDGTTIETTHTDAEGRMVLADTLTLASRAKPDEIIDFATLTGAMCTALGTRPAGSPSRRRSTSAP